ncbi:MAG: stage III sporulation protein AA, partial [Firmicutes bacterium]|nr:stage III sporulation protein AA [Bacillota bacterium]
MVGGEDLMPGEEYRQLLPFLPPELRRSLAALAAESLAGLEEVRLKTERPVLLRFDGCERFLAEGGLTDDPKGGRPFSRQEMKKTMLLLSESSVYAFEEELRRGYITLPGGHRAGFAGRAVLEKGALRALKDISSVNLRVARAVVGAGERVLARLPLGEGALPSTLLVAPPRAGKTTLLRDLTRLLSDGIGVRPFRV